MRAGVSVRNFRALTVDSHRASLQIGPGRFQQHARSDLGSHLSKAIVERTACQKRDAERVSRDTPRGSLKVA